MSSFSPWGFVVGIEAISTRYFKDNGRWFMTYWQGADADWVRHPSNSGVPPTYIWAPE